MNPKDHSSCVAEQENLPYSVLTSPIPEEVSIAASVYSDYQEKVVPESKTIDKAVSEIIKDSENTKLSDSEIIDSEIIENNPIPESVNTNPSENQGLFPSLNPIQSSDSMGSKVTVVENQKSDQDTVASVSELLETDCATSVTSLENINQETITKIDSMNVQEEISKAQFLVESANIVDIEKFLSSGKTSNSS